MWVPSPTFGREGAQAFFFCCLWVQVGAIANLWHKGSLSPPPPLFLLVLGCHHQVSVKGELRNLFFCSFSLLLRHHHQFNFIFLLLLKHHHHDLVEKELAPPFSIFLMLMGHHGQVSSKGKLKLPLFFHFLVFFFWA
jgi:hypothetical protein